MTHKQRNQLLTFTKDSQRGAVLIVGLVMVLLITVIGLSAIRGTGLQENMAGNMRDRNIAFQTAESALRFGESIVSIKVKTLPAFNCTNGLCRDQEVNPANSVRYWEDAQWESTATEVALGLTSVAEKEPRVILEELDSDMGSCAASEGSAIGTGSLAMSGDCIPFRITALGYGADANTQVIVQSAYKRHQ
jgi:type IV pilus assembly protein PilX